MMARVGGRAFARWVMSTTLFVLHQSPCSGVAAELERFASPRVTPLAAARARPEGLESQGVRLIG